MKKTDADIGTKGQPQASKASGTRSESMARRKSLILSHARKIIAEQGFDELKIRDLAERAELTVPTIYNLIGGKQDVLDAIIEELIAKLATLQATVATNQIDEPFILLITKLADLFNEDEDYYRAAFLAGDRSGAFEQRSEGGIYARSLIFPIEACRVAANAGLLRGQVPLEIMGENIYGSYRLARQDWTLGYIGLNEFRNRALTGTFLCLAADATDEYREKLMKRVSALTQ